MHNTNVTKTQLSEITLIAVITKNIQWAACILFTRRVM